MRKILMALCVCAGALCGLSASAEKLSFVGTTDRNPLEYAVNEQMTFTVTLIDTANGNAAVTGKNLRWTLKDDGGQTASGTATSDQPLVVTHTMTNAGCTRLTVEVQTNGVWLTGGTEFFDGGAVAGFANVREWPRPADFDAVWAAATNTLLSTPYTPVLTPYQPADGSNTDIDYFVYSIPVPSSPDWPATGVIALPKDRAAGELGIISHTFGYGYYGRIETPSAKEVFSSDGDNMVIHMTRYGEDPVGTDAYYADLAANAMKNYGFRNFTSLETCDQYMTHLRNLRALQYLKSRPEWNGRDLKVIGGSLGGYQALALAGLDPDVSACQASVPWSVDLGGINLGYMRGWRPDWVAGVTDYIDAKNFAYNITCPITVTAGLGDYTCPPSGQVQLYNILPSAKKKMTFTQNMGHGSLHGPSATCANYVRSQGWEEPEPEVTRRELKFVGAQGGRWNVLANWKDTAGNTNALPCAGDVLVLAAQDTVNDFTDLNPHQIKVNTFQQPASTSQACILDATGGGVDCTGYIYYNQPMRLRGTNVPLRVTSGNLLACRTWWKSADGDPCGIVKTGAGTAGLSPFGSVTAADYTGLKYIDVNEGVFAFGVHANGTEKMHCLPPDMVATFSARNATLAFNGTCTFTNFWIRETGTARCRTHTISTQGSDYTGTLTITGTIPVDETVFTGRMLGRLGFTWAPTSSAQSFVFSNRLAYATCTGSLAVKNGTLRF